MNTSINDRYEALDALRGVAAVLVIFFHVNWANHITGLHFFRHAFLFVDLFFILSGFIIAAKYIDRLSSWRAGRRFMILRFFRLYPLHLATLLILVALETAKYVTAHFFGLATFSDQFSFQRSVPAIFANFLFLQGTGILDTLSWNTPSWSISCEMVAYAAFSVLGILGLLRSPSWLVAPVVSGYSYIIYSHGTLNVTFDIGTIRCLCGFFFGLLIGRLPPTPSPNLIAALATGLAIVAIATFHGETEIFAIPAFALLVYALSNDECTASRIMTVKPLAFLGIISFSIYLLHYIVISLIGTLIKVALHPPVMPVPGWEFPVFSISPTLGDILVAAATLISIGLSKLTFDYIETPWRKFGYEIADRKSASGWSSP